MMTLALWKPSVGKHRLSGPQSLSLVTANFGSRRLHDRFAAARSGVMMDVVDPALTRASLLIQLREKDNHGAWQEFVKLYGPIIYGFARKRGLQDADAADLMQDVMRSVSGAEGEEDGESGSARAPRGSTESDMTRENVGKHPA